LSITTIIGGFIVDITIFITTNINRLVQAAGGLRLLNFKIAGWTEDLDEEQLTLIQMAGGVSSTTSKT
jgi:hypothetical protein